MSQEEEIQWDNYDDDKISLIHERIRKDRLIELSSKLESNDVIVFCEASEARELRRKKMIELVNLLVTEVVKR